MVSLTSLSAVALLIASGVIAAPWDSNARQHTHRARGVGPTGVNLVSYHPPSVFETYGVDGAQSSPSGTPEETAKSFLEEKLGVTADELARHAGHSNDGVSYEYFTQTINGIPVSNAVANVAMKDGKVVSYGASFIKPKNVAAKEPTLDQEKGIALAEEAINGKWNKSPVKLEYTVGDDGSCYLTHGVQVQGLNDGSWKLLYVDAHGGQIRNAADFVAQHSYRAVPLNYQDPTQKYEKIEEPADYKASPKGWHSYNGTDTTETSGNNAITYKAIAYPDVMPRTTRQSAANNNYDYPYDRSKEPIMDPNVDAARVNTFYIVNSMHDLTYNFGFDETAYNFQDDNLGKGGKGNDRIKVSVQDGSGTDNANFATPPDGQSGQMRMFLFTSTVPQRDGALENDIVVHEFTHGVSNRLTGGGTGECLQTNEAGGMGEGWSDAMADMTEAKTAPIPDFTLGSYVENNSGGIRSHPYSTNMKTNPLTYGDLKTKNEVHDIGEVWANMLHCVFAALVDKNGIGDKFDPSAETGNSVMLHLMMDGFQLQPCSPTFVSARDAILQADANRYQGKYKCLIWNAFAQRGLGLSAEAGVYENHNDLPDGC